MTKATYRRKGLFDTWFQKGKSPRWQGSMATSMHVDWRRKLRFHFYCKHEIESVTWVSLTFETLDYDPNDRLLQKRYISKTSPKQCHQLGIKHSNVQDCGVYFSFKRHNVHGSTRYWQSLVSLPSCFNYSHMCTVVWFCSFLKRVTL